jgi:hypothetical protein
VTLLLLVTLALYHYNQNDTMSTIRDNIRSKIHDAIWDSFAEGYYKAYEHYEQDRLRECIKACTDLLDEEASIPRFIRISTLILLALVVKEEVDFCAAQACMPPFSLRCIRILQGRFRPSGRSHPYRPCLTIVLTRHLSKNVFRVPQNCEPEEN